MHAGCFSMALAHGLASAGHKPERVHTTATVDLDKQDGGFAITRIRLQTEARVPGIDEATFRQQAETAKTTVGLQGAVPDPDRARMPRLV